MAITGTEIETAVRGLVNDDEGGNSERYTDAQLIVWINEFTSLIWRKRADSRYDGSGGLKAYAELSVIASALVFNDEKWRQAIIDGVACRLYEMEGDDTQDLKRAAYHASRFTAETGIPLTTRGG